ncbi:MAG: pro-sigmaK processing inhibitor BofA family protein [Clostridia bacterium]|nr:pro-sigmaK processing inhibitor BofA family protein [Clostridia bacterium]
MAWWLTALLIVVGAACGLWVLITAFRNGRPVRRLLGGTLQGACALAAVNVAGAFTGVSLGLNWLSGGACMALGVPGVITLLLLKAIFQI